MRHTFKVYERLKRKQHIETLFHTGKAFSSFPLKCIWLPTDRAGQLAPARLAIAVPKKKFRLSVHRQCVKRLIREAWRLNKHELQTIIPDSVTVHVFLIYNGPPKLPDYDTIEKGVRSIISNLAKLNTVVQ